MSALKHWLARRIVLPAHAHWEGNDTHVHLAELERSQFWSPERIEELRMRRLRHLLEHAQRHCPFWTRRFAECGLDPAQVTSVDDLSVLPILDKATVQTHREDMRSRAHADGDLFLNRTGGSTGQPVIFHVDLARLASRKAATIRHDEWTGWRVGDDAAYLWGARADAPLETGWKPRLRAALLGREIHLDTSSMTVDDMAAYRDVLRRRRPRLYLAYANAIYLFARYLEETGSRDHHRPRAIVSSAEYLDPDRRAVIERVFDCRVFNRYGSRETSVIASECDVHGGLHINAENVLVEIVRDGRPVAPGEQGKVLVTDLLNLGMPLIRYSLEDVATASADTCPCGRGLPLMAVAGGRVTDFLLAPDGRIVSGAALALYFVANAPGVRQVQLVQDRRSELVLRVVAGDGFGDATHRFFAEQMVRFFGEEMAFDVDVVDSIPLAPSGKHRLSVCSLDPLG
jgi:phenylacetate-CoA ligase